MPDASFNNEFAFTTFIKLFNYGYNYIPVILHNDDRKQSQFDWILQL